MSNLAQDVYTGAAEYGKFNASIGLIVGGIIGIILIIVGIAFLMQHMEPMQIIKGKVIENSSNRCDSRYDPEMRMITFTCAVLVEYTIPNGKTYQKQLVIQNRNSSISSGQELTLYYKLSDPSNVSANEQSNTHVLGAIMLGIGLILIISQIVRFYAVRKYKFVAAGSGAASVIGMLAGDRSNVTHRPLYSYPY